MEEHFPKMYLEMQALQERNPDGFDRRIGRIVYDIRKMMDLMETQPERGALMIQERQLKHQMRWQARRYHSAKNPNGRDSTKNIGSVKQKLTQPFEVDPWSSRERIGK